MIRCGAKRDSYRPRRCVCVCVQLRVNVKNVHSIYPVVSFPDDESDDMTEFVQAKLDCFTLFEDYYFYQCYYYWNKLLTIYDKSCVIFSFVRGFNQLTTYDDAQSLACVYFPVHPKGRELKNMVDILLKIENSQ